MLALLIAASRSLEFAGRRRGEDCRSRLACCISYRQKSKTGVLDRARPGCSLACLLEIPLECDSRHDDALVIAADVGQDAVTDKVLHVIPSQASEVTDVNCAECEFRSELRIQYHLDTP